MTAIDGELPADDEFAVDGDADEAAVELRPALEDRNERLDRYVAGALPDLSRSVVQSLIEDGSITVDGFVRKPKFKVTPGQVVAVRRPPVADVEILPEPIPLHVRYEDADLIVLEKPAGLVVHPAPGHPSGTLVNALRHHAPEIAVGGTNRPGIVHRLDKDTSGLMVVAKTDRARTSLVRQWEARTVDKHYLALVEGVVEPNEGTIAAPIGRDPAQRQRMAVQAGGRPATTHFAVLRRFADQTLLDVRIDTGRTHQIRVHLAFIGHPVVDDPVYGKVGRAGRWAPGRQFLHASRLAFDLPDGERVSFASPLPTDLQDALDALAAADAGDAAAGGAARRQDGTAVRDRGN